MKNKYPAITLVIQILWRSSFHLPLHFISIPIPSNNSLLKPILSWILCIQYHANKCAFVFWNLCTFMNFNDVDSWVIVTLDALNGKAENWCFVNASVSEMLGNKPQEDVTITIRVIRTYYKLRYTLLFNPCETLDLEKEELMKLFLISYYRCFWWKFQVYTLHKEAFKSIMHVNILYFMPLHFHWGDVYFITYHLGAIIW